MKERNEEREDHVTTVPMTTKKIALRSKFIYNGLYHNTDATVLKRGLAVASACYLGITANITEDIPDDVSSRVWTANELLGNIQTDTPLKYPLYFQGEGQDSPSYYLLTGCCGMGGYGRVYNGYLLDHDLCNVIERQQLTPYHDIKEGVHLRIALKLIQDGLNFDEVSIMKAFCGVYGICPVLEYGLISYENPSKHRKPALCGLAAAVHTSYYFVMPYLKAMTPIALHDDPTQLIRCIYKLLTSLACLQQVGLCHRDIKPGNFLMDSDGNSLLIDFGMCEFTDPHAVKCPGCCGHQLVHKATCPLRQNLPDYIKSKTRLEFTIPGLPELLAQAQRRRTPVSEDTSSQCMVVPCVRTPSHGTAGFRSPEDLLMWPGASTLTDVWSVGATMITLMSGKSTYFHQHNNYTGVQELVDLFGTDNVIDLCRTLGRTTPNLSSKMGKTPKLPMLQDHCDRLKRVIRSTVYTDEMYELLALLLEPNPFRRVTAVEALRSSCFSRMN